MKANIFNGCLLGGWFLLTLGGIMWNPAAGLIIGGVSLLALTGGIALRWGVYDESAPRQKEADKAGDGAA
jgi:hypothetical protein